MDLTRHADAVERLLKGRRIDGYEIAVAGSRDLAIEVKQGTVDAFRVAEPFGVSLRLLAGHGMGFSYSTALDDASLERMVEGALVAAQMQSPDEHHTFAEPCASYPDTPWLFDPSLPAVDESLKVARVMELERLVLDVDPRVKRVRKCSYGESVYHSLVRNSLGLNAAYSGTYNSCSVSAVAESDGDAQTGWDFAFSPSFAGIDLATVAVGAGRKATGLLGARTLATMRCQAVLDNRVAADLLDVLAGSFLAENVHKGKSLLAGRVGERLFPDLVSVRDNGLLPDGMGSAPCDGEGVPQRDTPLVVAGVLRGYLYDSYWGGRLGARSTGNAVRAGIKSAPKVGIHNLHVEPGAADLATLLAGVRNGVFITEVMGMHTANAISGDFSVGAAGFYVEDGEVRYPVKGLALAGNLLELFGRVDLVGNDLRFFGSTGSPSLRIAELDVSGT
ncbi:TldD/PmbA family protein [Geomonas azotofigens]|uniref:TldD/PmbA family protein n=1 Tax=Geomonas azotofigens TaxID=2843196 RepID=UPI001C1179F4|nr:TldD/PmbA family protein [Geomonas azotofigens]MBU5612391.1 TldD/PmbA family protein [Geomonas azotofigens]